MAVPCGSRYLGDARHEKGYQLLPQIIDRMWADYAETNRVRFVIQSDCHLRPAAAGKQHPVYESRMALGRLPPEKVTLIDAPLESSEFCRQTLQSDIGLLPYERSSYAVRCSGIFVDLLTIGVPMVVPAGSWLADQLAEATREYHVSLRHGPRVCGRMIGSRGHCVFRCRPAPATRCCFFVGRSI